MSPRLTLRIRTYSRLFPVSETVCLTDFFAITLRKSLCRNFAANQTQNCEIMSDEAWRKHDHDGRRVAKLLKKGGKTCTKISCKSDENWPNYDELFPKNCKSRQFYTLLNFANLTFTPFQLNFNLK